MGAQSKAKAARRYEREQQQAWKPMVRVQIAVLTPEKREMLIVDTLQQARATGLECERSDVERLIDKQHSKEMYENGTYTVLVDRTANEGEVIHLSIRRTDRARPGPNRWRDFQCIKNDICGEEAEGVELYPSESRVVDSADQYHVWVMADPKFRLPFGWDTPFKTSSSGLGSQTPLPV